MKVALVIGPCPPGTCGVGDYARSLAAALTASGADTRVIASGENLLGACRGSRALREQNFDITHIQYPTVGFGTKVGPFALSLLRSCVVTIHEASEAPISGKLSMVSFAFRSKHVVFTSEFERQFAVRWIPWIVGRSSVIPVGSNVPIGLTNRPRRFDEIVHFGLLHPGKGLEQVLELSSLIRAAGLPLVVRILGNVPPRYRTYYETLRSQAADLPVVWSLSLSEQEVAAKLSEASFAYLPYPGGATERRTTLKAALLNGLAVITTRGAHTPQSLETSVKFCQTAQEALRAICTLMNDREEIVRMAGNAVCSEQAQSWEQIARQHLIVYRDVLCGSASKQRVHSDNAEHETRVNAGPEIRETSRNAL